jgi:hypothetical protein
MVLSSPLHIVQLNKFLALILWGLLFNLGQIPLIVIGSHHECAKAGGFL